MLTAMRSGFVRGVREGVFLRRAALAGLAALFAQADMPPGVRPFALAFFAAGVALGESAGAMLLGCLLAVVKLPVSGIDLGLPIGCAAVLAGALALDRFRKRGLKTDTLASVLGGAAALAVGLFRARGDPYRLALAVAMGIVAAVFAKLFCCAMRLDKGKDRWTGWEKLSVAATYFAAMTGFGASRFPEAGYALAGFCALAFSREGPAPAALAGAVGASALLTGGMPPAPAVTLPLAGAAAGLFLPESKLTRAVVFLLAGGVLGLYAPEYAPGPFPLAAAALLQAAVPDDPLKKRTRPFCAGMREAQALRYARETEQRVLSLASAIEELADAYSDPAAEIETPDEQTLIAEMRTRLCTDCRAYGDCWAGENGRAVRLLCRLLARAVDWDGKEPLFEEDMPPDVRRICRRANHIPDRLSPLLMDFSDLRRCALRQEENCARTAKQLQNAVRLLRGRAEDVKKPFEIRPFRPAPKHTLYAQWGSSCLSMQAGVPSGDSHLVRFLPDGRLMVLLADGMGSGEAAAQESARAVRLLWKLLSAEADVGLAVNTVNEYLLSTGPRDMFVTVDLCLIDLFSGRADFWKLAASPSLILRNGKARVVEGGRLPLGVLEGVCPGAETVVLLPGDVLFMATDGVMELNADAPVEAVFSAKKEFSPADMAENAVRYSETHCGRRDDMTCVCVRLSKNKRPGENASRPVNKPELPAVCRRAG